ncbi:MAG: hypothetical protein NT165_03515 [Candidatus Falkowbacteria bacterium]|nr:hypothetical protein [Candidatus Falkowbacteria bacterium]
MKGIRKQIKLIGQARQTRSKFQKIELSDLHFNFLRDFFRNRRFSLVALGFLLLSQGLVEAILIIFSRNQLVGQKTYFLATFFWQFLVLLLLVFFVNSYFSIRQEKTLGVFFANKLRRRIFKNYINQPLDKINYHNKAGLIAKISYQLPLASMGFSNSFFGLLRWLINLLVITILSVWSGLNWSLIILILIFSSVIIAFLSYLVSKNYISQEVTFYSRIMEEIDDSSTEKYFLKIMNRENDSLRRFDRLVKFDSFFRVRRDLWIKLCAKVVFALLLVVSIFSHFFSAQFFSDFGSISSGGKFLLLFLLIYFSRAIYESLRIGLYFWPGKMGLFLSVVERTKFSQREKRLAFHHSLDFYSRKLKLFKGASYWRHCHLAFSPGEKYLFYSNLSVGKSALAKALSGMGAFQSKALRIKIDGRRFSYRSFQRFGHGICFFDPGFYSEKSLLELIVGRDRAEMNFSEIEKTIELLSLNPSLFSLVAPDNNFNASAAAALASPKSAFAIFSLWCLKRRPRLIVIDNFWIDLGYQEIKDALATLEKSLPESTFIIFSRKENNYLTYYQKYEIKY